MDNYDSTHNISLFFLDATCKAVACAFGRSKSLKNEKRDRSDSLRSAVEPAGQVAGARGGPPVVELGVSKKVCLSRIRF